MEYSGLERVEQNTLHRLLQLSFLLRRLLSDPFDLLLQLLDDRGFLLQALGKVREVLLRLLQELVLVSKHLQLALGRSAFLLRIAHLLPQKRHLNLPFLLPPSRLLQGPCQLFHRSLRLSVNVARPLPPQAPATTTVSTPVFSSQIRALHLPPLLLVLLHKSPLVRTASVTKNSEL